MSAELALDLLARNAPRAGVLLDFDGTLAPIVADPPESAMTPEGAVALDALAGRLRLTAVISGRPAAFLASRVTTPGVRLLGLYGLEEWDGGRARARAEAAPWEPVAAQAFRNLAAELAVQDGIYVEEKGLSVAVHWRNAPDREAAAAVVATATAAEAARTGLAREPGKLVEELRPPVDWDKGATVAALSESAGLAAVVYVGDDLGDVPAFRAAQARGGLALAVDHGAETPAEVLAAADGVLTGVGAVAEWLGRLGARLGA